MKGLNTAGWCILLLAGMALYASDDHAPFATRVVSMQYPRLAAMAQITGTVTLRIRIDSTGKVLDAKELSGHPILVKAAKANIKLWRFSPGLSGGEKAESEFDFNYVFELKGVSEASVQCSQLTYEYPDKVTITSEAPHMEPGRGEAAPRP